MAGSVLSVSSRALLAACVRLGHDVTPILEAAGLERRTLDDPDVRLPIEQADALWRKAYEVSGDSHLALHAIEVLPFGAYRVIDFLASSAPTIGAALAAVSDYFPLIRNGTVRLPYVVGARQVTFALDAPSCPSAITRPFAEYTLAAVFLRTRMATGQPYTLMRVEFSHPRPPDIREHERIFDAPVAFDAESCRLVLARDVWDTPRAGGGNPDLFAVLDTHAKMLLAQLPAPDVLVDRVREAIDAELRGGQPHLVPVARRLAMSPRTLQRRLRAQGLVFNDVLDARRFRAARAFLAQQDVAAAEAAYLLGFADVSSFHRAFKRWSGLTPAEYRRRAGG